MLFALIHSHDVIFSFLSAEGQRGTFGDVVVGVEKRTNGGILWSGTLSLCCTLFFRLLSDLLLYSLSPTTTLLLSFFFLSFSLFLFLINIIDTW